jgi:hypothetical protein
LRPQLEKNLVRIAPAARQCSLALASERAKKSRPSLAGQ